VLTLTLAIILSAAINFAGVLRLNITLLVLGL